MTRLTGPRRGTVTGLVAAGVLLAACSGPAATLLPPAPPRSSTSPPPASATAIGPTPASLRGFAVASVTFVSAGDGWVLGTVGGNLALAL